jgi:hypothetical protein
MSVRLPVVRLESSTDYILIQGCNIEKGIQDRLESEKLKGKVEYVRKVGDNSISSFHFDYLSHRRGFDVALIGFRPAGRLVLGVCRQPVHVLHPAREASSRAPYNRRGRVRTGYRLLRSPYCY